MRIELRNITFSYYNNQKPKLVLNNISLCIESAKSVAIVGSSGSGKSTILRLIAGLLPKTRFHTFSGKIFIDNLEILENRLAWQKLRSNGTLGFMFQEPNLLPNLTVEENIYFPLKIIKHDFDCTDIVLEYLNKTGLIEDKDKLPCELSGGMRTRVALARTFATKPKLLLLDEPFSSLDLVWKSILYKEVKNLKKKFDTTIILVTHDIFEAIFFSNNIIVLGDDHEILKTVNIKNWSSEVSYNDVIRNHHDEFVEIKKLIEEDLNSLKNKNFLEYAE